MVDEGLRTLDRAVELRAPGAYQLQAAIAAMHARAPRPEDTDWPEIASRYTALAARNPSPVVSLNRAVANAMADGPGTGLPRVDERADEHDTDHQFQATRADLLRRLGRGAEAEHAYRRALALATNPAERRFLEGRLAGH